MSFSRVLGIEMKELKIITAFIYLRCISGSMELMAKLNFIKLKGGMFTRMAVVLGLSALCLSSTSHAEEFTTPKQDRKGMTEGVNAKAELPNVLILGDSISIGYTRQVRKGLEGKANVFRPKANCGDTPRGLAQIDKWLGDKKWHVIHFNWGLWDLCYRHPESKTQGRRDKVKGMISTPLPEYEKNIEKLVIRLKKTGATLIWASTTVVPEGEAGRVMGDDIKYNTAAAHVMKKHGVAINDLHKLSASFAPDMFTKPGDVHYTPKGSAKLAEQVVIKISKILETKK